VHSCLYEGRVRHERTRPVAHAFEFPLFLLYLDLAELPQLFRGRWLWSAERPALAWFRRRDHLGDPELPLADCVRDLVETRTGRRPDGPIRLLTHLRYAGCAMNPVSFFYCFDAGGRFQAIVAEVTSTPWRERHCYVLEAESCEPRVRARSAKELHVSPFMGMDLSYRWDVPEPGPRLSLRIANHEPDGGRFFDAVLSLERCEIGTRSLARVLVRYPLLTLRIVAAIYWQAWRLYRKGAPFHPHPDLLTGLATRVGEATRGLRS